MTIATIQRSVSWRESGGYQFTPLKTSRKTKKRGRAVNLPAGLAPILREHRTQQAERFLETRIRSELVFCSETGGPLHPRNVTMRGLKPTQKAPQTSSTIPLFSLRHSFASVMLALGVHIKLVSEVLGHSRVDLTLNTYSHLAPGLQEDATNRLDRALYQSDVRTVNTGNTANTANTVRTVNTVSRTNTTNTREQVA